MNWDDRKFVILNAIIRDYISTAEPVGSRTLEKKYNLGVSSATIRNEMSDLEDMGLLEQPHTSSGRIPSTKAYRIYVDNFMRANKIDNEVRETVKAQYEKYMLEINKSIEQTLNLLTQMTNYTSLVVAPKLSSLNIKDIKLVYIDEDRVMLILVTKEGLIKNQEVRLTTSTTFDELSKVNNILVNIIKEISVDELTTLFNKNIAGLSENGNRVLSEILPVIRNLVDRGKVSDVYSNGISKIFNYPEFNSVERAKHFIDAINKQEALQNLVQTTSINDDRDIHIAIGSENKVEEFRDCSVITANYKLNGKTIGTIGVIGPTRMNYDNAVSTLDLLSEELTKHINKIFDK